MNYRHHFHAGNFADVVKHAVLLALLARLTRSGPPIEVLDTHAGAGVYELDGEAARRSGEADAGILRLLVDPEPPPALMPLAAAVRRLNGGGERRLYPGSPWLAVEGLRSQDRYVGCELRADDHAALERSLRAFANAGPATALERRDGFAAAEARPERPHSLLLVDPPYEQGDDYARIAQALAGALGCRPNLVAAVWAPIKDLETFDALRRSLESLPLKSGFVAEVRLRPLVDPMRLNGCAMIVLAAGRDAEVAADIAEVAAQACAWAARSAAEAGGLGRVMPLRG